MMKRKMKIKKMRSAPKKNKERINMNATIKFNECFESLYYEEDLYKSIETVSEEDLKQLKKYSKILLPDLLLDILNEGVRFGFEITDTDVIVQFWSIHDILATDDNFSDFKKDVEQGIIFGTDLGDSIYYYGMGKGGLGLYIVGGGVGNYYQEAFKFAETFTEFFIEGKGVDLLDQWANGIIF